MSRWRRLILLACCLAFVCACGAETDEPPGAVLPPAVPLEPSDAQVRVSRLELLRQQIRTWIQIGGQESGGQIRRLYEEIVERHDPDDVEARRYLGYTDFHADILGRVLEPGDDPVPEGIANRRGYPFIDAVTELGHRRWLLDPEDIKLAQAAVAATHEHARRLQDDHRYRLGDTIRANIATDATLSGYNYETAWAPPHLICYASDDYLTEFDLLKVPYAKRREVRETLVRKRQVFRPALEAKARVFSQLYDEFMRRYAKPLDLKPVDEACGGRPDYRPGVRSYPDGVPIVVWVFVDEQAFQQFHMMHRGGPLPFPFDSGYFRAQDGWLYIYDAGSTECSREKQVRADVQMGVHQLLHWFARQRNKWKKPTRHQSFFRSGLANYLSGVRIAEDLALEFTGLSPDLLDNSQRLLERYRKRKQPYPFFPLEKLVLFDSYSRACDWGEREMGLRTERSYRLFVQQSWMFITFLQDYDDGRYGGGFLNYFNLVLDGRTGFGQAPDMLLRSLHLDDDGWADLQEEFETFVTEDLLKREIR